LPKIDLTNAEVTELLNAVDLAAKSAKRAQNTGKTPQIKEVYRIHEQGLLNLEAKLKRA